MHKYSRQLAAAMLAATFGCGPAFAQSTGQSAPAGQAPAAAGAADAGSAKPDAVIARVNGQDIHASDLHDAAQALPQEMRNMPPQMLYPMLLDQLIDRKALVLQAQKMGLDKDPAVQRQINRAQEQALQQALLQKEVGPSLTEAAVHARYNETVAGKPGEEEVHARHILVASEDEAKKIIAELKAGADFSELAKKYSTDPGAQQGGDLGFFKKADMLPEFSAVAFALQPGQVSPTPVHTQYGWHVIKVEERRTDTPATYEASRDQLRQTMIQEGVQKAVQEARAGVSIEKFNQDGTPQKATDAAEPPQPAKP